MTRTCYLPSVGPAPTGPTPTFKNDDYHADLDAENIYRLILTGKTFIGAVKQYYPSLSTENTRADIFLSYIPYSTVVDKVFSYAIFQANIYSTVEDVNGANPDTYDFLKSLQSGLSDIADFV